MNFKDKINDALHLKELLDSKIYIIVTIIITILTSLTFEHIININLDNLDLKFEIVKILFAFVLIAIVMVFLLIFTSFIINNKYIIEYNSKYRINCREQSNYIFTEVISKLDEINANIKEIDYQNCELGLLKLTFELNKFYLEIEIFLGNDDIVKRNNAGGFLTIQMFISLLTYFDETLSNVISVYEEQRIELLSEIKQLQKKLEYRLRSYDVKGINIK